MRFYEITGRIKGFEEGLVEHGEKIMLSNYGACHNLRSQLKERTENFNVESADFFIAVCSLSESEVAACLLMRGEMNPEEIGNSYFSVAGIVADSLKINELTFKQFRRRLRAADRYDIIDDDDIVLSQFDLHDLVHSCSSVNFEESILDLLSNKVIDQKCRALLTSGDLKQELSRIRMTKSVKGIEGHPVHYLVRTSDTETRNQSSALLLTSLLKAGRLKTRRVCSIPLSQNPRPSRSSLDDLFDMSAGGVILIDVDKEIDLEDDRASEALEAIERICHCVQFYRNKVLAVWRMPMCSQRLRTFLFEHMGAMSFVEVNEQAANTPRAKRYLSCLAKECNLDVDDALFGKLEKGDSYLASELRVIFEEWRGFKLKTDVYPQYASVRTVGEEEVKKESRGSAHEELMSLVGLDGAKRVINGAIDFHRIQKYLLSRDVTRERPSYHMLFTGNPGSAKTTVARLFGRIMRENDLLPSGHVVEVGRADLVGRYVGHTAPLVQKCFKRAEGGVLFIDEAYSLVEDRDGCFGDEAINTIVQEMENRRDSVVVILAGYPDKMQQFLQKNPGLSSRISFHVNFPDYSTEELCKIASLIASKKGLCFAEDAQEKLADLFDGVRAESDFGNGRYARSVIEKAMMAQASRLAAGNLNLLKKSDFNTILAADIEIPEQKRDAQRRIGFCA